ncbi:MAG: hypothetical protein ACP5E4_00020 [Candidatus Aenigmatarchaeota archaeon]
MGKVFILALVFMSLMLATACPAIADSSIGGSIDRAYAKVYRGGLEKFEISIFSIDDATIDVKISAGTVEDIQVDVLPKSVTVKGGLTKSPDSKSRWVIIGADEYARVYPVYVYVRVPQKVTKNRYSVPVTVSSVVSSGASGDNGVVQKVVQALQYNIEIEVPGDIDDVEVEAYAYGNTTLDEESIPAYRLPGFSEARQMLSNFFSPTEVAPTDISAEEDTFNETPHETKPVPTGYLSFGKEGGAKGIGMILIFAAVLAALVLYLLKK